MDRITVQLERDPGFIDLKLIRMKHAASLCKANEVRRHVRTAPGIVDHQQAAAVLEPQRELAHGVVGVDEARPLAGDGRIQLGQLGQELR